MHEVAAVHVFLGMHHHQQPFFVWLYSSHHYYLSRERGGGDSNGGGKFGQVTKDERWKKISSFDDDDSVDDGVD